MRLFIGIELPDDVKTQTATAIDQLRDRVQHRTPAASIRWVEESNLHLTLWFLGEVGEDLAEGVSSRLSDPFSTGAFQVRFERFGAFPPSGPPRVLWAGIAAGGPHLAALHGEVQDRMVKLGFEPEARPYAPHLTVARVKDIRRADGQTIRELLATLQAPLGAFSADGVTLFRSRTSPKGARYERLLRVPLM